METYTAAALWRVGIICFILGGIICSIAMFFICRNNPALVKKIGDKLKAEFDEKEKALRSELDQAKAYVAKLELRQQVKEILIEMGIKKE